MVEAQGWIKLYRAFFNSRFWQKKRSFSEAEAFLWILCNASWKDRNVFILGKEISIQRGELVGSLRFLGHAWGWNKNKVDYFLKSLSKDSTIRRKNSAKILILSVENYERYQADEPHLGTALGQDSDSIGTLSGQDSDKSKKERKKEGKKVINKEFFFSLPDSLSSIQCQDSWLEFIEHRKEIKKPLTERAAKAILEKYDQKPDEFINSIQQSIQNGWVGLFPVKDSKKPNSSNAKSNQSIKDWKEIFGQIRTTEEV